VGRCCGRNASVLVLLFNGAHGYINYSSYSLITSLMYKLPDLTKQIASRASHGKKLALWFTTKIDELSRDVEKRVDCL